MHHGLTSRGIRTQPDPCCSDEAESDEIRALLTMLESGDSPLRAARKVQAGSAATATPAGGTAASGGASANQDPPTSTAAADGGASPSTSPTESGSRTTYNTPAPKQDGTAPPDDKKPEDHFSLSRFIGVCNHPSRASIRSKLTKACTAPMAVCRCRRQRRAAVLAAVRGDVCTVGTQHLHRHQRAGARVAERESPAHQDHQARRYLSQSGGLAYV